MKYYEIQIYIYIYYKLYVASRNRPEQNNNVVPMEININRFRANTNQQPFRR